MSVVINAPVVLDTNTVLSALLFNQSSLSQLRLFWQSEQLISLASKATISALIRVLAYPKFKLTSVEQRSFLDEYLPYTQTITKPEALPEPITCRDSNDVMFLELALAGDADYLITGDKDLLVLPQIFQFKTMSPTEFINNLI